jgi:NTE family protein
MKKNNYPKIGLALGSGGPKGLSHIGVIKVLEENGIFVDYIAGSSIGALIGGFYSATKDISEIEEIALTTNWSFLFSLIDPSFHQGLVSGEKLKRFIEEYIDCVHFQDLLIPFSVVATDLKNGEAVFIDNGGVSIAIRASISFPLVFKPVLYDDSLLADGGLSVPVPVKILKKMGADIVIAVNLNSNNTFNLEKNNLNFYTIACNSLSIMGHQIANYNLEEADIIISPKTGYLHWGNFVKCKKIIVAGEEAMKGQLLPLQRLLYDKNIMIRQNSL